MKVFILLAIIFFSWRVFSSDGFYYEGTYYKVDEYIRFQEDPQYQTFLNSKKIEAQRQKANIEKYLAEKEKENSLQERTRREYVEMLSNLPSDADMLKEEAQHEKELEAETKKQNILQARYLIERDAEEVKSKPTRMIASTFEMKDRPLKRVPREKRKFIPTPKVKMTKK